MECLGRYNRNNARCFECLYSNSCSIITNKSLRNINWQERDSINNDENLRCLIISQLPEAYRQKADCYKTCWLLRIRNVIYNNPTKLTIRDVAAITLTSPCTAIHLRYSDFPPRDCNSYEVRFERKDVIEWMKQKNDTAILHKVWIKLTTQWYQKQPQRR